MDLGRSAFIGLIRDYTIYPIYCLGIMLLQ